MAKVTVELGQRAFVNGKVREAGEKVSVDESFAEALAYVPKVEKDEEKKDDQGGKKSGK